MSQREATPHWFIFQVSDYTASIAGPTECEGLFTGKLTPSVLAGG